MVQRFELQVTFSGKQGANKFAKVTYKVMHSGRKKAEKRSRSAAAERRGECKGAREGARDREQCVNTAHNLEFIVGRAERHP